MAFGLLKHFKDIKKSANIMGQMTHADHLIIGHDLGAVLKLIELKKNHAQESVKLISSRPLNKNLLIDTYELGVTHLRSEVAVENIYKKFYNAKIMPQKKDACFYKDGKFHEFSGRAKSMELQPGESFFMSKGYRIKVESFFDPEDWEQLDETLKMAVDVRHFEAIEKTLPNDLVNRNEWHLTFKDFSQMTCERLYVSQSPKRFLSYLSKREDFTPELIDVCTSVNIQSGIAVSWKLKKELFTEERTLFIPQSMTHEWGHFILEFEDRESPYCHALFLIHDDEPQTEDLASRIKLMKRVIERVFPQFEESILKEFIRFDEEMFISDWKDEAAEQVSFDYPTLKFVSQIAPMPSYLGQEKFMARVLLN